MKKKLTRIWGVGLVIVLLSTLFIAATPASGAEPLRWEMSIDQPFWLPGMYQIAPMTDISDYTIDSTGMTLYIADGTAGSATGGLWQSTSGGYNWSPIGDRLPTGIINTVDYVALAPDDPDVVVVASSGNTSDPAGVAISVNGGSTFTSMNFEATVTSVNATMYGLEISPLVTGGYRYITVFGNETGTTNNPFVYSYNYGAGVGSWRNVVSDALWTGPTAAATLDSIRALAYSPSFPSDYMAVAISEDSGNTTDAGTLNLHVLSYNSLGWDDNVASGYPVTLSTASGNASAVTYTVNSASISLLPDYDGGDESLRIAFVGASIYDTGLVTGSNTNGEVGGVWQCYDYIVQQILGTTTVGYGINSVAYDGTNLAAGTYLTNNVYRSADPLVRQPTFLPARSHKKIGIDDTSAADKVQLTFVGETLYGAKTGTASALSKSTDYGNTWNDFTFIDDWYVFGAAYGGGIDDIYYDPSGNPWYLAAHDAYTTSVYRLSSPYTVQRVLCVSNTGAVDFMLRGTAADPDVIYAADKGGTAIYYTADGGLTRWYKRTAPKAIADLAVESKEVIYIGNSVNIYKSVNSGFTWALPVNTQLSGGAIYSMLSVSEDNLIVGSDSGGYVNFSTDGGTTWTPTFGTGSAGGTGAIRLAATGLTADDYIFAAPGNTNDVYRAPAVYYGEFKSMNMDSQSVTAANATAETNTGLVLTNGVLYAVSSNGTVSYLNRTLTPTVSGTHSTTMWGTRLHCVYTTGAELVFNTTPTALRSSSGSIKLYAADTAGAGFGGEPLVFYLNDDIALTGVTITGPADASLIQMNSISGNPYDANLMWSRISKATAYEVQLSLDSAFTSLVNIDDILGTAVGDDPACEVAGALDAMSLIIPGTVLQPGTTYYWRVRSYLPLVSAWSETRSFIVQPGAAEVPTIGSPANGGTVTDGATAAFSWSPVAGADTYEFQLATDTAFASPLYSETLATTGVQPGVALEVGVTYFWRVRALEPVEGDWSIIANFTVAAPAEAPVTEVTVPEITVPEITVPEIVVPEPKVVIEEAPEEPAISEGLLLAIIIIGAVLVIAVIVLIVRTRRQV